MTRLNGAIRDGDARQGMQTVTVIGPSLRRLECCAAMEAIRLVALPFVRTIVLGHLHR
jgi:hypothetical protein